MATFGLSGTTGAAAGGLNFDTISDTLSTALQSSESSISSLITTAGASGSTTDLLNLQVAIQKWTLVSTVQSTVVKDLGDSLKGIIQKAS